MSVAARVEAPRKGSLTVSAAITARGLKKSFGNRNVIRSMDLHIPAGQFLAVVGRSGCGKSTLLRLLAGLDTADAGTIRLGDGVTTPNVRLMFQEPRLLPWARVADNVAVGLDGDLGRRERGERSVAALVDVGLADRADVWPSTLSGGQKQRVALARALVSGPSVLALDEPLGALDALTRIEMQRLIHRVTSDQGCTVLLVTHDVSEAVALADRVVVLEEGRIALDVDVGEPHPRKRGSAASAAVEERILAHLLEQDAA